MLGYPTQTCFNIFFEQILIYVPMIAIKDAVFLQHGKYNNTQMNSNLKHPLKITIIRGFHNFVKMKTTHPRTNWNVHFIMYTVVISG